jgi:hypothetical protein
MKVAEIMRPMAVVGQLDSCRRVVQVQDRGCPQMEHVQT